MSGLSLPATHRSGGLQWQIPLLIALTLLLAALPEWVELPLPQNGVTVTEAIVTPPDGAVRDVALPHTLVVPVAGPARVSYELVFHLDRQPQGPQELYIPAARHAVSLSINGRAGPLTEDWPWTQPAQGVTTLTLLPHHLFTPGENRVQIMLDRVEGSVPFYLSQVHLDRAGSAMQAPWLKVLLGGQLRLAAFALHLVVLVGLLTLWTARRHDPIFRWLALLGSTTFVAALPDMGLLPNIAIAQSFVPVQTMLIGSFGLMALGLALTIAEFPRPRWLIHVIWMLPLLLLAWLLILPGQPLLPALAGALIALSGHLLGGLVLISGFVSKRRWDMGLLAVPLLLVAWIGLRDVLVVAGLREAPFLLSSYLRPLTILTVVVLLMRRLATSLNNLDGLNDQLRQRLAAQERELLTLHDRERQRAAQAVREEERQRLTRDLHDGLSGHLVSIIALSERGAEPENVERAARAALTDLRLVINSLDIGDEDLPLALAGLRERLEPQLRRLDVALDWSMDKLPDISGVTPGNALSVLRILQEAVTNALKHGTPGTIEIEGRAEEGGAAIAVRNDRAGGEIMGSGRGLDNMRRRAEALGGKVRFACENNRATLVLHMPLRLEDG